MNDLLRVYLDPGEIGKDGYPRAWHRPAAQALIEDAEPMVSREQMESALRALGPFPMSIKDYVRQEAGHRCERCGHPYLKGNQSNSSRSEWTLCDEHCAHTGPMRWTDNLGNKYEGQFFTYAEGMSYGPGPVEAQWRILTVHHLNGVKHDCRWWNLAALCQRCHLAIQGRVNMDRVYPFEHTEWFKPHAAGWYAWAYLGEDLSREETMARLDELLDLERVP